MNREIAPRAKLAREANTERRSDTSQGMRFNFVRRRKFRKSSLDADAAGCAAPTATAHRYMREPHSSTNLQHRKTNRSLDRIISWIRDGEALASLPLITNLRAAKDQSDQAEPVIADPVFQVCTHCSTMWIGRKANRFHLLEPSRVQTCMGGSRHSNFGKPEKGAKRNEHVEKQDSGERVAIPSVEAEPKMQTDSEMAPDEKDKKDLAKPRPGINPEVGDFVWIIDIDASENPRPSRIDDMNK